MKLKNMIKIYLSVDKAVRRIGFLPLSILGSVRHNITGASISRDVLGTIISLELGEYNIVLATTPNRATWVQAFHGTEEIGESIKSAGSVWAGVKAKMVEIKQLELMDGIYGRQAE